MCGYLGNVTDSPLTRALLRILGIEGARGALHDNRGSGPASRIDLILDAAGRRQVRAAVWWLLLEPGPDGGFKPSRYTSFNTRHDRLDEPRSIGYRPYRHGRCLIPASYIIEGEGAKGARRYHRIEPADCAFALGGLYRRWTDPQSGEETLSCSVITLPPHPAWRRIHTQSTPLFLPTDNPEMLDDWLDPELHDVARFAPLLRPALPPGLRCTPIDRPSTQQPLGEPWVLTGAA